MEKFKKISTSIFGIFLIITLVFIFMKTVEKSAIERQEKVEQDLIKTIHTDGGERSYNLRCIDGIWYFSGSRYMSPKYSNETLKPERCGQEK